MDTTLQPTQGRAAFYVKRTIGAILILALSATFLFSGYSKIYSDSAFDNFQWTFLGIGINSVVMAGVIARLMIGFEFLLGLLLLAHVFLKQFTYKAVIITLSVFIVYLLLVIMKEGNTGNCGCFGDKLAMTPLNAIWKNLAMIAATVALMYLYPVKPYKFQEYVLMTLGLVSFSVPFLLQGVDLSTAPVKDSRAMDLDRLYSYQPAPEVDLRKGKHIIAYMSLTCPHCKKAAYLMQIIHKKHPEIPMYLVIDGHKDHEKQFFDETHAQDVPHLLYPHTEDFTDLAGPGVPAIYWVNDGKVEYKSKMAYYQLDPKYMLQWMKGGIIR